MADEVDIAAMHTDLFTERAVAELRAKAALAAGAPGDCDLCGEHSMRLVDGACAHCRDKYQLP